MSKPKHKSDPAAETTEPADDAAVVETPQAEPMKKPTAVFSALSRVVNELAALGISKERKNQQQGFNFRGIDDIHNVLAGIFAKNRLIVLPSYGARTVTELTTEKGKRMVNVVLAATYKIISLDDQSFVESGPFYGEAMDTADKATNKAMSVSYKYFAIQTFSIPIVGSDDPDLHSPEPQRTPQQATKPAAAAMPAATAKPAATKKDAGPETVEQAINRLCGSNEPRKKKLHELLQKAYSVPLVDQIPAATVPEAIARMEAYIQTATAPRGKKAA